jgi:PPOX class probable F420-dependent enzyme
MELDLGHVRRFVALEHGLAVVSVRGASGSIASSVVNAGVLEHPVDGSPTVGFVVRGDARKAAHLRRDPHCTLVWRSGWRWIAVSGESQLVGPDDQLPAVEAEAVRPLLRSVFVGAGGSHDDWDEFDRVMAAERRCAVLVRPVRIYGQPG